MKLLTDCSILLYYSYWRSSSSICFAQYLVCAHVTWKHLVLQLVFIDTDSIWCRMNGSLLTRDCVQDQGMHGYLQVIEVMKPISWIATLQECDLEAVTFNCEASISCITVRLLVFLKVKDELLFHLVLSLYFAPFICCPTIRVGCLTRLVHY